MNPKKKKGGRRTSTNRPAATETLAGGLVRGTNSKRGELDAKTCKKVRHLGGKRSGTDDENHRPEHPDKLGKRMRTKGGRGHASDAAKREENSSRDGGYTKVVEAGDRRGVGNGITGFSGGEKLSAQQETRVLLRQKKKAQTM